MKIQVSSKSFSEWLKSINIEDNNNVLTVGLQNNKFDIMRANRSDVLSVESKDKNSFVMQHQVRWDWLLRDLSGINEQPVEIEFLDNIARFTLSY